MIFEGLLRPTRPAPRRRRSSSETALARIRQLSAHEVGHTLGLGHNYYDSTKGRISVMDYPHPLETLKADGTIDLSKAYPPRIGEWDKVTINYGYRHFPAGPTSNGAHGASSTTRGGRTCATSPTRTSSAPKVDQWSNGTTQADELNRMMKVRRAALARFGETHHQAGAPMATIEEPLVPIFMYHRYSVESAASMVGGQHYIYAHARRRPRARRSGRRPRTSARRSTRWRRRSSRPRSRCPTTC